MSKRFVIKYDKTNNTSKYDRNFTEEDIGFRSNNTNQFKNIISFVHNIIEQINFKFTREGILLTSMDSSHVTLVNCLISPEFFSVYNFTNKKNRDNDNYNSPNFIGINLSILLKILNYVGSDDEIIFKQHKDRDSVDITIIGVSSSKYYNIKLMEIMSDEIEITQLDDTSYIALESRYFQKIINEFSGIGETIDISINKKEKEISLKCEGEMTHVNMVLNENSNIVYENLIDVSQKYSIKNMELFSKGYNINKHMYFYIGDSIPLKMGYNFIDNSYVHYYIAPKIDDYDDYND